MIYTFGDGFAAGHIWPEWPQILEAVSKTPVTNFGHIGAGNEYIFNCAVKSSLQASSDDTFLIQWAEPGRFDKIVQDQYWKDLQKTDPQYHSINAISYDQCWWSTSASKLEEIQLYKKYIQSEQAINRTVLYMISLSKMLDSLGIKHFYFLTTDIDYSHHSNYSDLQNLPWLSDISMARWSKDNPLRDNQIQPSPIVHFQWVIEKILPKLGIDLDKVTVDRISDIFKSRTFEPFYYDRAQQWKNIVNEISVLC